MDGRLFARLATLFDVDAFAGQQVLVLGCGSGGGQVALQLVMSGVQRFALVDKDELKVENVIRHVCGLRYVGDPKVTALADVLRDRNPKAEIETHEADLLLWDRLDEAVARADLVVLATDNEPTRYLVNECCVRHGTPFVVGRVFTRGIGGDAFVYRPGRGGCLACLEARLERSPLRNAVREVDLLPAEERDERLYGLEAEEIKDSPGLAVDIAFITAFHTRLALDALAESAVERPRFLPPIDENYIAWGNRAIEPFSKNFHLQRTTLSAQEDCRVCEGASNA